MEMRELLLESMGHHLSIPNPKPMQPPRLQRLSEIHWSETPSSTWLVKYTTQGVPEQNIPVKALPGVTPAKRKVLALPMQSTARDEEETISGQQTAKWETFFRGLMVD